MTLLTIRVSKGESRLMENFVIAGKARTVFRLIELKAKREEASRRNKKRDVKKQK